MKFSAALALRKVIVRSLDSSFEDAARRATLKVLSLNEELNRKKKVVVSPAVVVGEKFYSPEGEGFWVAVGIGKEREYVRWNRESNFR